MRTYTIYKKDGTPVQVEGPEGATTRELVDIHLAKKQDPYAALARAGELQAMARPGTIIDQIQELGKGTVGGLAGLVETAALGAITPFGEETELALREKIQSVGDVVQEAVAPDANIGIGASAVPRKFGEALGSFAGILAPAAIPFVGPGIAASLAVGAGAGEASERAREEDATQEERNRAAKFGAAIGLSEIITPLRLLRKFPLLNKAGNFFGDETAGGILARGRRVLTEAGVEGAQEFAAAVAQNAVERGYNLEQTLLEETGEPAAYGSAVGFTAKLADEIYRAIQMITPRTRGGSAPTTVAPVESDVAADKIVDDIEKITTDAPVTEEARKAADEVAGKDTTLAATDSVEVGPEPSKVEVAKVDELKPITADLKAKESAELDAIEEKYKPLFAAADTKEKRKLTEEKRSERQQILGRYAREKADALKEPKPVVKDTETNPLSELMNTLTGEVGAKRDTDALEEYRVAFETNASPEAVTVAEGDVLQDDKTTVEDKKALTNLIEGKVPKSKKVKNKTQIIKPVEKALIYFKGFGPTPQAALDAIAFDIGQESKGFKRSPDEIAADSPYTAVMAGTGKEAALEAKKWVDANLNDDVKTYLTDAIAKARSGRMTDKQLSERADTIIGRPTKTAEQASIDELNSNWFAAIDNLDNLEVREKLQARWDKTKNIKEKEAAFKELKNKVTQQFKAVDKKIKAKDVNLAIPSSEVTSLTIGLDPEVNTLIEQGDAKGALNKLSEDTQLPEPLSLLSKKMSEVLKDVKIVVKDLGNLAGRFDSATNTIEINPESGMNAHVLMHEAAHAVTFANLANKSHPTTKQLNTLFEEVKDNLGTAYGAQSLQEFVSETFSNPQFQKMLAGINIKGQPVSALQRFTNTVVNFFRQLIGKPTTPLTALESASMDIAQLLAPTEDAVGTGALISTSDPEGAANTLQNIAEDSRDQGQLTKEEGRGFILDSISFLGDTKVGTVAKNILTGLSDMLTVSNMANETGLVDDNNVGFGEQLLNAFNDQRGDMDAAGRDFEDVKTKVMRKLKDNTKRRDLLDELIYSRSFGATIYQVDPTKPRKEYENKNIGDRKLEEVWDDQQKIWKNNPDFGQQGRDAFDEMRNYYKRYFTQLQEALGLQADKAVGGEVDADGVKVSERLQSVFKKIFDNKALDVYFPLVREGNYVVAYNIKPEIMKKRKDAGEDIGDPRVYELVSTQAEQVTRAEELKENPDVDQTTIQMADTADKTKEIFRTAPPTSFVGQVMDILNAAQGLDKTVKDDLQSDIVQLFINTLPETSFAKSLSRREGVKGYIPDSVFAFNKKGLALGRQVAQLKNNANIRAIVKDMTKKAKELEVTNPKIAPAISKITEELNRRAKFATQGADYKGIEQFVKTANQLAFVYTIGANASSALVNLSQVPLFVYPYLGAEYGFVKTSRALGNATRIVTNSGNNIDQLFDFDPVNRTYKIKDSIETYGVKRDLSPRQKEIADSVLPLIKLASQRGQLTRTFLADALGLGEEGGALSRRKDKKDRVMDVLSLDNLTSLSAVMFNQAERFNRQVTLLTSYQLALRQEVDPKGKMKSFADVSKAASKIEGATERAAEKALRQTQETNGGAVLETGPRYSQQNLGRVAFMYKTYGLRMYSTMLKSTKELMDKSLPPEDRYIAFKQLAGVHVSALLFAGVQGLPLYGAIEMIANAFLGEDDEDFDSIVRGQFREPTYKGLVNYMTGVDVATRIRLTGLLIQENRFNRDASLEESFFHYAGGPAFGTLDRINRGALDLGLPAFGERKDTINVQRAIESFLPAGIANVYKALGRVREEGYKTRRGDPIFDDVTTGDLAGLLFGFPPVEYTNTMEKNDIKNRIDKSISKKKTTLTTQYYRAYRTGDASGMAEALQKMVEWNRTFGARDPKLIITPKGIERSVKRHIKTSENIAKHNGVFVRNKNIINEISSSFNDDYTFFD